MLQFLELQRVGHDLVTVLQQPPPEDLSHPVNEPMSIVSPALAGRFYDTYNIYDTSMILTTYNYCFIHDNFILVVVVD